MEIEGHLVVVLCGVAPPVGGFISPLNVPVVKTTCCRFVRHLRLRLVSIGTGPHRSTEKTLGTTIFILTSNTGFCFSGTG
ncbi:hypothetical protein AFLA_013961 [Aspergillus flavus NRRL3357]|nr:hypothetical protein AFLA_013961 [Aspergillus flavus NRRL3357]